MEPDGTPAGQENSSRVSPSLPEVLNGLTPDVLQTITEVIALHREFPAWAVWLPQRGGPWTAVRPASARPPGPNLPLIWVDALTMAELDAVMRRADAALAPG